MLRAVNQIVEATKPAHAMHRSEAIFPDAQVGIQSRLGLDLVVGAATASATQLRDGCHYGTTSSRTAGVLGVDTRLGARRPEYVHRFEEES
jgi:hypothetical protein